jgi:hypothetical protein
MKSKSPKLTHEEMIFALRSLYHTFRYHEPPRDEWDFTWHINRSIKKFRRFKVEHKRLYNKLFLGTV